MLLLRRSLLQSSKSISLSLTSTLLPKTSRTKSFHTTTINMSDMKKIFTSNSMAREYR
jgi:hypothetical protein